MTTVSALIMASNEEEMLPGCLAMLGWADEVVVLVDDGSVDRTADVARETGARVYVEAWRGFAGQRNRLAELATCEWLLYVDADERTTPAFSAELRRAIEVNAIAAYSIPTRNVFLGRAMKYGGWWPDRHYRLVRKSNLKGWSGTIHETPDLDGGLGLMRTPIVHLGHRVIASMLAKTVTWSQIEARRRAEGPYRPVTALSLVKTIWLEIYHRLIRGGGWRDGPEGWIEVFYQSFSSFLSVAQAWELQRPEPLVQTYRRLDQHLQSGGTVESFE